QRHSYRPVAVEAFRGLHRDSSASIGPAGHHVAGAATVKAGWAWIDPAVSCGVGSGLAGRPRGGEMFEARGVRRGLPRGLEAVGFSDRRSALTSLRARPPPRGRHSAFALSTSTPLKGGARMSVRLVWPVRWVGRFSAFAGAVVLTVSFASAAAASTTLLQIS